jgi:hypothetical protein
MKGRMRVSDSTIARLTWWACVATMFATAEAVILLTAWR